MKREMTLTIDSDSANEAFARTVVAAYVTRLDPTLEELADIKTAVSEAVTNSIIHGYGGREVILNGSHNSARNRADVSSSVTSDFCLVTHAAEGNSLALSADSLCN